MFLNKLIRGIIILGLLIVYCCSIAYAAPKCAILKFYDSSDYQKIESHKLLEDLVLLEIVNNGLVRVKESHLIEDENVRILYDPNYNHQMMVEKSLATNNFDDIFDSDGFNKTKAASIQNSVRGQIVSPEVIAKIGKEYDAEYIIQGTVMKLDRYEHRDKDKTVAVNIVGAITKVFTGIDVGKTDISEKGISAYCSMRLIRVSDGMVVWSSEAEGICGSSQTTNTYVKYGVNDRNGEMFFQAVENASHILIKELTGYLHNNSVM